MRTFAYKLYGLEETINLYAKLLILKKHPPVTICTKHTSGYPPIKTYRIFVAEQSKQEPHLFSMQTSKASCCLLSIDNPITLKTYQATKTTPPSQWHYHF